MLFALGCLLRLAAPSPLGDLGIGAVVARQRMHRRLRGKKRNHERSERDEAAAHGWTLESRLVADVLPPRDDELDLWPPSNSCNDDGVPKKVFAHELEGAAWDRVRALRRYG